MYLECVIIDLFFEELAIHANSIIRVERRIKLFVIQIEFSLVREHSSVVHQLIKLNLNSILHKINDQTRFKLDSFNIKLKFIDKKLKLLKFDLIKVRLIST